MPQSTFLAFADEHEALERLFVDHQLALIELDLPRAGDLLGRFDRRVRAHARWEEEELLPPFESRVEPTRHGAPEIFRFEHRKIAEHLDRFREQMTGLRPQDPEIRRRVLELIDEERIFKELMHHHAEREEKTLYPDLDRVCSAAERARMIAAAPRPDAE